MTEPGIFADGLTRNYGRRRALDALTLAVEPGRVVALLGPNGAGKSTLLRLLGGLLAPTAGSVRVLGLDPRGDEARLAGRIAALHEGQEPPAWAPVARLLALQAAASPAFDRAFADELLFARSVESRTPFGALSKGQRRWVLSGLALASGAPVVLLDEPADGLDPAARRALYDAVRRCASEREATVIVATHIIHDVERVADDVALLRQGRLLLHAALEDLRDEVREVAWPERGAEVGGDAAGSHWLTLARRRTSETELAWLRVPGGADDDALRRALPPGAKVRTVGLEDLYLALAETAAEPGGGEIVAGSDDPRQESNEGDRSHDR
jgi:ABC-2 type transport system ATP-binding protein